MEKLSEEYTKNMIRNMIQALEYQRDKLWSNKNDYEDKEWNELNTALTTMIMALSL